MNGVEPSNIMLGVSEELMERVRAQNSEGIYIFSVREHMKIQFKKTNQNIYKTALTIVKKMIAKDMMIGELVQKYPSAAEVLMDEGVHCVGCGAAYFETIEQGLAGHGKSDGEIAEIVKKLNDSIPKESGDESLVITENAAKKAKELLDKREKDESLRIEVTPGGCAGNEYRFSFTAEKKDGDEVVEVEGVKFLVDKKSMELLKGSKIDYVDSLSGAGFKISNPNAKSTCGCGQSFN